VNIAINHILPKTRIFAPHFYHIQCKLASFNQFDAVGFKISTLTLLGFRINRKPICGIMGFRIF